MSDPTWTYESLKRALRDRSLPLVLVDVQRFDANARVFAQRAAQANKTIRLATKAIRVPALIQRAFAVGGTAFRGLMCYNAREACFLASLGFDDLLVAYPTVDPADVAAVGIATTQGSDITLTVDCVDHLVQMAAIWQAQAISTPLQICLDLDVSWRPSGIHVGAQRSPVRTVAEFEQLVEKVLSMPTFSLRGVITYDAQLAGVTDINPFAPRRNFLLRMMKRFSATDVAHKRNEYRHVLRQRGIEPQFFNGGGTGSFEMSIEDPQLTEVTIGSGLLQPHLFDYYRGTQRPPAFCFALPVTRRPQADRITCQSGGFIASGAAGLDRAPIALLPSGLRAEPREGFGEVQTPLIVPSALHGQLQIGDPIFFRPAKAGEIAERFTEYNLMQDGQITEQVPTYRGLGQCFH